MEAHAEYHGTITNITKESEVTGRESLAMKRCAEKIWNAISKYVVFENDAIFKDPNWPYLWDKKK